MNQHGKTEPQSKRGKKKTTQKQMTIKHDKPKAMGCNKSSSKRDVYSNTILPQETQNISNYLSLHVKQLEKEEQKKHQSQPKERNHKDQK